MEVEDLQRCQLCILIDSIVGAEDLQVESTKDTEEHGRRRAN